MLDQIPLHLDREGIKEREDGERGGVGGRGVGNYSREVIISDISIKGRRLLKEAINRGTAVIRGNRVTYHPTGLSLHTSYPENAA